MTTSRCSSVWVDRPTLRLPLPTLAAAADIDLSDPIDVEEIGIGGGVVQARFVSVTAYLHPLPGIDTEPHSWSLEVGFIDEWRPLYPCILGNVGFLDQFTVTLSRLAQATAIEPATTFARDRKAASSSRCSTA